MTTSDKPEEEAKPGVLDNVQNQIHITIDLESGQYNFAIGNAIPPFHLINVAALLQRMAFKIIDGMEQQQQREIAETAAVMRSLKGSGGGVIDPFGRMPDRKY